MMQAKTGMKMVTAEQLDGFLRSDDEYQKCSEKYNALLKKLKEQQTDYNDLWLELDETVGAYSASCMEIAYIHGFHEGVEEERTHERIINMRDTKKSGISAEDLANLICACDAYKELNVFLHGGDIAYGFDEGVLGKLGRIYNVISNCVMPFFAEEDVEQEEKILSNTSLSPMERAKLLLER